MSFVEFDGLKYFQFDNLSKAGAVHGIFTRHGGVSQAPWASLNHGGTVGDPRANVIENRRRVFAAFNRPVESIFDVWQVHSADVVCSDEPRPLDSPHQKADAIVTDRPTITLLMRFADCVPILLFDPIHRVVSLVHAGWQGTVKKVAAECIRAMVGRYGCNPHDILAGIGPSISMERYPVGAEVVAAAQQAFPGCYDKILFHKDGKVHLDLWRANQYALEMSGVQNIEIAGICTAGNTQDWYSHRGEAGKTGRFGALLALPM